MSSWAPPPPPTARQRGGCCRHYCPQFSRWGHRARTRVESGSGLSTSCQECLSRERLLFVNICRLTECYPIHWGRKPPGKGVRVKVWTPGHASSFLFILGYLFSLTYGLFESSPPNTSFLGLFFLTQAIETTCIVKLLYGDHVMRLEMWLCRGRWDALLCVSQSPKPVDGQSRWSSLHEKYNTPQRPSRIDACRANCLSDKHILQTLT